MLSMATSYDIDFNSRQEGRDLSLPTYAAVTARSYHAGGINSASMDGSVGFITSGIDLPTWRAWEPPTVAKQMR